jgi:hypothetical protein
MPNPCGDDCDFMAASTVSGALAYIAETRKCERCNKRFYDDTSRISPQELEKEFPGVNWNICGDCLTEGDL